MLNTPLRPMGIGRILDRSFQLYRKHFVKLTLIMLMLYGPFYLLQHLLLFQETANTSASILSQIQSGASLQDLLPPGAAFGGKAPKIDLWKTLVFVLVLLPLFMLAVMPASIASVVHLVKAHLMGEQIPGIGQMLKKSFSRFWPLVGSTVLYGLIVFGMYVAFAMIVAIFAIVFALGSGLSSIIGSPGAGTAVFVIIFFILLGLGIIVTWSYFLIRWGYYLPIVALGEDSIGLSGSWRLTRKSFWRLFLMFFVLILILYLFQLVLSLIISAALGLGLGAQLLQSLLSILVSPLWLLPYAISLFDLKVRNEGLGLESLINTTVFAEPQGHEEEAPVKNENPEDSDNKNE
ncbi:hypothetical protein [Paenibacillus sp. SI8]|uniref:hypothetical protein n=1 Tax=unclassified Paenibacillus TaxID=185978 RepID=UPI003465D65E